MEHKIRIYRATLKQGFSIFSVEEGEVIIVVSKKQIITFLVITFCMTYTLQFIAMTGNNFSTLAFGTPLGMLLYILSTLSPTIASFFVLKKSR